MTNRKLALYQVNKWNEYFENNRSRQIDRCNFVCAPNDHGPATAAILNECDGAAIIGIWHLILGLCSRQRKPREGYLTIDGRRDGWRLGCDELGHMWNIPPVTVGRALAVLSSHHVAWINLLEGVPESARASLETSLQVTPENDTLSDTKPVNERKKKGKKEPPTVPQGGQEDISGILEGYPEHTQYPSSEKKEPESERISFDDSKRWLNSLFGRQRPWSYEEDNLLSGLMPISKEDRALLSWGYTLPVNDEGWTLVSGEPITRRKQNLIQLLREFSSEVDKWRTVRKTAGLQGEDESEEKPMEPPDEWTEKRWSAFQRLFPGSDPGPFHLLGREMREQIDSKVNEIVTTNEALCAGMSSD